MLVDMPWIFFLGRMGKLSRSPTWPLNILALAPTYTNKVDEHLFFTLTEENFLTSSVKTALLEFPTYLSVSHYRSLM